MIIVLADDFTGAAEVAGIAAGHGLETRVVTPDEEFAPVHVNVIDTNTRSRTWEEAAPVLRGVLARLAETPHRLLYKKTDSVFRGHVYGELNELLRWNPQCSILLAPANPTRGRTIADGTYQIHGTRLHETVFSSDPESPIGTSRVVDLMRSPPEARVEVLEASTSLDPEPGTIYIAEAETSTHVLDWAFKSVSHTILPAGGADFFDAILSTRGANLPLARHRALFVCGSSLSHLANLQESLYSEKPAVVQLEGRNLCNGNREGAISQVCDRIVSGFEQSHSVILLARPSTECRVSDMPRCLAEVASRVLDRTEVHELYIEGGTTSSEVVRRLGWSQFRPIRQVAPGVVRLKVMTHPDRHLTVKPGSYAWPERIHQFRLEPDARAKSIP